MYISDRSKLQAKIKEYRRHFHKYPELGWTEYATAVYISDELERLGFTVLRGKEVMNDNGLMGLPMEDIDSAAFQKAVDIYGEDKLFPFKNNCTAVAGIINPEGSPSVVLRFDTDALPIQESKSSSHFPYYEGFHSRNDGIMHSCGHDGHTAIGLGLANVLHNNAEHIKARVTLLFQPAEEGVRGADAIVRSDFLKGTDYIISSHLWANMPYGKIVCSQNGTAATDKLDIVFSGKSSHAGISPEKGNNAMLAGANAVINLHAVSRSGEGYTRINTGKFTSGTGRNIIPEYAKLEVELRAENQNTEDYLLKRCSSVIKASAEMYDCEFTVQRMGQAKCAKGDEELAQLIYRNAGNNDFFSEIIKEDHVCRGSEDFTSMMNYVQTQGGKACFMGIGASPENKGLSHHTPDFDINEDVLLPSVILYSQIIKELSENNR